VNRIMRFKLRLSVFDERAAKVKIFNLEPRLKSDN
jgi:hypothetical protein